MSEAAVASSLPRRKRKDLREEHMELREQSKAAQRILEMLERSGFVVASRHVPVRART